MPLANRLVLVMLMVMMGVPAACAAGSGSGAILYTYNTSARFSGLGDAGVAAPWGAATNHWANPAQLAYRQGLQHEWFQTQPAQGLADDIYLDSDAIILGFDGLTVLASAWPVRGLVLDMGWQEAVDENGESQGLFRSYMKSTALGVGLDLVRIYEKWRARSGDDLQLSRTFSLSVGYVHKSYEDRLAPDFIIQDSWGGGAASASTRDLGWSLRVTPVNTLAGEGALGLLLGAAYGSSVLNGGDVFITHPDADQSDPMPKAHVSGWSVHGAVGVGRRYWEQNVGGFLGRLHATFNPLLSLTYCDQSSRPGYLWDADSQDYVFERDDRDLFEDSGSGWEVGLANTFFIRRGKLKAPYAFIDADTEGWGVNLQMGRAVGLRYDKATVPRASGLDPVDRETWAVWVDPWAW
jgi:hypothetical protein